MLISEAQADLRRAYAGGGPGVIISGAAWLAAAFVQPREGEALAFAVLFLGGMTIYPLAVLINRGILKRAAEAKDNPFGMLVLEGTIAMVAMLFAAWLFLPLDSTLVMPIAAIAAGTHCFAFRTAYGDRTYWLLGAALTILGFAAIYRFLPLPGGLVLIVALAEIAFGVIITWRERSGADGHAA